jgi:hypothetical protein
LFHDISGHIRLREVLCNYLRNNKKTVIYNDEHGGAKFEDLFVHGDGGCKSYNAYLKVLRKPNVYADVMLVYALIYKFQVNVEIVDTLTGEYKTYRHREGTSVRTILLVQRTTAFV